MSEEAVNNNCLDKMHGLESDRIRWYMICVVRNTAIDK